jgi:hydrogenase maturation protease
MILVIGYGNTLRQDDGAGHLLAESIAAGCRERQLKVKPVKTHQLVPELAVDIARPEVTAVIFADVRVGESPQTQGGIAIERLSANGRDNSSGHHVAPGTLLLYAQTLFGHQPPGWLVTVPGINFDHGEELSAVTQAALEAAPQAIAPLIKQLLSTYHE